MEKYDKVTDEQLIRDFRNGDREIMDHLMMKYKAMVRKKARAMYLFGGENEDLIQEGMIGLIKAVRDYDPDQGASFASFAELCVSRQMYSAIEASKRKKHMVLQRTQSIFQLFNKNFRKFLPQIQHFRVIITNRLNGIDQRGSSFLSFLTTVIIQRYI